MALHNKTDLIEITADENITAFGYQQELKRTLNFRQIVMFALNFIAPLGPTMMFGYVAQASGGTIVLAYLVAAIAMLLTANSYALMVKQFPLAGSTYNYLRFSFNKGIGFLTGWILLLDYIVNPTIAAVGAATYIQTVFPSFSYTFLLTIFIIVMGLLNLFGINAISKIGIKLLLIGYGVFILVLIVWTYHAISQSHEMSALLVSQPFKFNNFSSLVSAGSLAIAGYLGFDAVTSLSEESHKPTKYIPIVIYGYILFCAVAYMLMGYLLQLVLPNWDQFQDERSLIMLPFIACKLIGGEKLAIAYALGLVINMIVFNLVAVSAGSRLLYGIGRDNLLPRKIFGAINKRWQTPHWNIVIIITLELIIGKTLNLGQIASLINYGALLAFAMVNMAVIKWFYFKKFTNHTNIFRCLIAPFLGTVAMLWIFSGLDKAAIMIGTAWSILGMFYYGFRLLKNN